MPESKNFFVVEVRGRRVRINGDLIARVFLGFCENSECDSDDHIDPLLRETETVRCSKCRTLQSTAYNVIQEACEELPPRW